jgi:hypothetical protein
MPSRAAAFRYTLCGLELQSELELDLPNDPEARPRHRITLRAAPAPLFDDPGAWAVVRHRRSEPDPWLSVAHVDGAHLLRAHGTADFRISPDLSELSCAVLPTVPDEIFLHALVDGVLPQLVGLLGYVSLHASAVAAEGGRGGGGEAGATYLFLGDSGAGKSTLAATLVHRGPFRLVSDDTVALSLPATADAAAIEVHRSYAQIRLHDDSALGVFGPDVWAEAAEVKARIALPPPRGPLHLAALFVLEPADGGLELARMKRTEAVGAVARHLDRLYPDDRDALAREFEQLERIVATVPAFRARVPHDYARADEVVRAFSALELATSA